MKRFFSHFFSVIIFLTMATQVLPTALEAAEIFERPLESDREYGIGPENVLQIDVFYGKGEKISQKVKVSSRGFITFSLLGEVEVRDLTVSQVEKKLAELLGRDYIVNPQVSVFVEEYSSVSVIGEVQKPGSYPIEGRMSVVQLISKAQGFTKIALQNAVKVIRTGWDGSKQEILVDVGEVIASRAADVTLRASDVVVVEKAFNDVSILGQVVKPSAYPIEGQMTVTQLVAIAGGFTKIAAPNNTRIIRTLEDGSKQEIRAKLKDIMDNREADIPLKSGDMVIVAESMF